MGKVAIIGVGQSTFVRKYPGSIRELAFEGFKEAITDAGITAKEIDASVFCSAPEYDKQRSPSAVVAEEVVSETVPRMTEEQMELFRAHGEDSDSFFLRMTSLEMWADEIPEDSASAEDEGEDETGEESDGAEPVTSQP